MNRLLELLHRYRYLLAPLSFGAGLASFLLIERRAYLAQWLSALLLIGWLVMLFESALARRLRIAPGLLRYGIQAVQQETFFFTLPFFLHVTDWRSGQAVFTGGAILAGLCTMWDPLYYGRIVARPALNLALHAFAAFLGTLVIAPLLLHLTTAQTLRLAGAGIAVSSFPALLHLIDRRRALHWLMLVPGCAALGALPWLVRPVVPPATLWVADGAITERVDFDARTPGVTLASVSAAQAHQQGLYAWTAIHAPRGLQEEVWHRWVKDGVEIDRIPMRITGGREQGYRAWSYKRSFPADPRGHWQVQAVTGAGQRIGQIEFDIM